MDNTDINKNRFVTKFSGQQFFYDIFFQSCQKLTTESVKTAEGRLEGALHVSPDIVHQLVIEDDLLTWFHRGTIVFQNNQEILELGQKKDEKTPFIMRHDARNLLIIRIEPVGDQSEGAVKLKREDWSLEFEFVIYDTEDLPHPDPNIKLKKAYFWDLRYQILSEIHTQFSTFLLGNDSKSADKAAAVVASSALLDTDPQIKTTAAAVANILDLLTGGDIAGAIKLLFQLRSSITADWGKTGEALLKLISDVSNGSLLNIKSDLTNIYTETQKALEPTTEQEQTPAVDPTADYNSSEGLVFTGDAISALLIQATEDYNLGVISQEHWDQGGSKIFYTSPGTYTALDNLTYLLDSHVGKKDSDICLFTMNRYSKEFELIPFANIFEFSTHGDAPGKFQFEHFYLEKFAGLNETNDSHDNPTPAVVVPSLTKAPVASNSANTSIDISMRQYSTISNYRFVDMAGIDSSMTITSRPVYSYNFRTGTFRCEYKDNTIGNVKKVLTDRYVKSLFGKSQSPLLTLNQTKTMHKSINPIYSTKATKESRLNDGLNKVLRDAIYLNECITFDVLGSTNRRAGRFVGIDKQEYQENNDFENKFFGQWFITNVKHVFTKDSYANQMLGVKIHSYQDAKINEEIP